MNDKDYICMIINNMFEHLKEIKTQVQTDKYEEANEHVDGILSAAEDLNVSLKELFKLNSRIEEDKIIKEGGNHDTYC